MSGQKRRWAEVPIELHPSLRCCTPDSRKIRKQSCVLEWARRGAARHWSGRWRGHGRFTVSTVSTKEAKGASKTRDSRSVSKLRHTRGPQHGLGCGGASQAVTWIRELHTHATIQASSSRDSRLWLLIMEGKKYNIHSYLLNVHIDESSMGGGGVILVCSAACGGDIYRAAEPGGGRGCCQHRAGSRDTGRSRPQSWANCNPLIVELLKISLNW